ncbi:MAG: Mut7-C ubiquitin/RNAse domain-containing protein [Proteobacteria bacterium]|nr:Mut7-C ubiquitin/RNAse domain-containing protein [Pseudomonadota bacterium]
MKQQINIRFYEELNDFLPQEQRKIDFNHALKKSRSIKDLIESIGVPHAEVDLIIVNGESVDFDYPVQDGDRISVYPVFESLDISPLKHCQPAPLRTTCFVLDVHLGRLAAYLRMLGFDTLYRNDYDDPTLADISADEHRILLTCDRRLLMRKQITHGYFVRSRQPQKQILEILTRFDLYNNQKPFTRCMHCNGKTHAVNKQDIETRLLPKTIKYYDEFYQCEDCGKIYWQGSHFLKMQKMIDNINVAAG